MLIKMIDKVASLKSFAILGTLNHLLSVVKILQAEPNSYWHLIGFISGKYFGASVRIGLNNA